MGRARTVLVLLSAIATAHCAAPAAGPGRPGREPAAPVRPADPARPSFRDCPSCPDLVAIQPGRFIMGGESRRDEQPRHPVTIAHRIAVGRDKVSVRDWKHCVLAGLCKEVGAARAASPEPVVLVSWVDVQQYLAWLALETGTEYRLLSEAEWEYIAGSAEAAASSVRGEGLEWTSDCWHADYTGAPADGSSWDHDGDCRYHVARGRRPGEAAPSVSTRHRFPFNAVDPALGFRVARTLP